MATVQPIMRARVAITGTNLEKELKAARAAPAGPREKLFKRIDETAAVAAGGKKGQDARGVPDILKIPSGSILGQLLSDGTGVDPDIEWKAVTGTKAPEILSSVVSHTIPTFQELIRGGKMTIEQLSGDIATSVVASEQRLRREQAILSRTRGAKAVATQQGKVDATKDRLLYKREVAKDLRNAIVENPGEVFRLLGTKRNREIIGADAALMADIRRKVNNIAFAVIKDPAKKRKVDGLFLISGLGRAITIDDLEIEVKKEGNSVKFAFRFKKAFFRQLIGDTATKATDNLHKFIAKPIQEISASGQLDQILGMGISLAPGGRTPITLIYNLYNPVLNYRGRKGKPKGAPTGAKEKKRGQFISGAQLSALLQAKLAQVMPRYPQPTKPTPRYITGKLARSFRVNVNYRSSLMSYYNTPPASQYVDQLNTGGWQLDETLVEPTIRQITQQLFGRQFRVLRTQ